MRNTSKTKGHRQFEREERRKRCALNKGTRETWRNYYHQTIVCTHHGKASIPLLIVSHRWRSGRRQPFVALSCCFCTVCKSREAARPEHNRILLEPGAELITVRNKTLPAGSTSTQAAFHLWDRNKNNVRRYLLRESRPCLVLKTALTKRIIYKTVLTRSWWVFAVVTYLSISFLALHLSLSHTHNR